MHVAQAGAQRVELIDWEAQRAVKAVALVGIVRQIGIVRFKAVVEDAATQADTVNGKVRVGYRQFGIRLVVVLGAADPDRIAGTQPVILLNARLEADAAFRTVTDTEVQGTGIALFHLVGHVHLIGGAGNALGFNINGFKVAQAVQTLFALLNLIVAQPCAFHLTHFAAQHRVFTGVVAFELDPAHIETVAGINVDVQLDGFIRVVDFRLGLYARVSITITAEHLLDVVFHLGHFTAVVQLARLDFGQLRHFRRVAGQAAVHYHVGQFVLFAFGDIDSDVDAFFVRRQADLRRINIETRIAAIQIEAAQDFKIPGQFLFLVFAIADNVPPRHFITQLEAGNQLIVGEGMIPHDIDLLNLGGNPFREDQFKIDTVARQRRDHGFHRGAVLTDAVVEVFQAFFNAGNRGAIECFPHPDAGGFQVLLEHVIFHRFVAGEGDAGNGWALFHLDDQRIPITQDADVLEVARGKQRADGITDVIVSDGIAYANRHIE